ncbi:MAG: 30S ribosomal protein S4 [Phycisphaerales bacterium]|nr:30S ribosomal protein S4 [Phycisphaerales bacterium]MCI0629976.1 30S ribosomal protein S4 [Phycisphaerales bacterium]MCI0677292.1 30S ribosomal protein S4 [Phycisphaerales bacterium]
MARYLGPKVKLSRRVGVPIADVPKHTAKRQLTPPGMHGYRGRRLKDYGVRQNEKQKLRYHYGVLERQFRRYVDEASRGKGNTGEALLQLLEQRLDNVIRRAGFTRTVWASRQMVVHGHVLVNGKKVDRPSQAIYPGDVVTLRERGHKLARENMESMAGHVVPSWMDVNPAELTARVHALPTPDQVPFDVNTNLIVEFYR